MIFILIFSLFLSCRKQKDKENIIPIKLSLLYIYPYEKRFETGYALEARIINIQHHNIAFRSPQITFEQLDSTGKWQNIFDQTVLDLVDREKFFPNERDIGYSILEHDKKFEVSKNILKKIGVPIQTRNLAVIQSNGIYMTFLKKDSIRTISRSINTLLDIHNTSIYNILKGKYRAYCKIKEEHLFHKLKFWNDKNQKSDYELPSYWGSFKYIKEPKIQSDTIYFEVH